MWLALSGSFVGLALLLVASVATGSVHTPAPMLLAAPALLWLATWFMLVFGSVWWYRRGIATAAAAPDLETRERAGRLMQVRAVFVGRNLAGVDVAGLPTTRVVRWLDSWRPIACHGIAALLVVLAAVAAR